MVVKRNLKISRKNSRILAGLVEGGMKFIFIVECLLISDPKVKIVSS